MGAVGFLALSANIASVLLLVRYKDGDANVRSVWLCSRNDAIGNVAVMIAALGVWGTATGWPDLIVAAIMAGLFLTSAFQTLAPSAGGTARGRGARPLACLVCDQSAGPSSGARILFSEPIREPRHRRRANCIAAVTPNGEMKKALPVPDVTKVPVTGTITISSITTPTPSSRWNEASATPTLADCPWTRAG